MKLAQAVSAYVAYRQSLGMRFATEARALKSFSRALGDVDLDRIEPEQVRAFLDGTGAMTRFWYRKLDALRGFYRFALARRYTPRSPLPTNVPRCPQAFVPYIYSEEEIKRLLAAAASRERCNLSSLTCRTLLLVLYGTGLRIGEALGLDVADVDLESALLRIRETKFYKTRIVPVGADLTRVLRDYLLERSRGAPIRPRLEVSLENRLQYQLERPRTTRSRMAGIDRTRTLPPSFGISFFLARSGTYVRSVSSFRICSMYCCAPRASMSSNVTPSMPGAPLFFLAIVYACCSVSLLHT